MIKRAFIIVLDSFGIGELPDAADYGDTGSNTLLSISKSPKFHIPNLRRLGLLNIDGVTAGTPSPAPEGCFARMNELSKGKDTTIGHWEMAGIISEKPLPTFPHGFPGEVIEKLEKATGRKALCNRPYSGTEVIAKYGQEHVQTGALIVYTSADSVLQIAAHEDVVPLELLYEYCQMARDIMTGEFGVGRIIARPFIGDFPNFKRTSNRHDFSLAPPKTTMLDLLMAKGFETLGVGKINDIFVGKSISWSTRTQSNRDGMEKTIELQDRDFYGLCFVNLVDFDMLYGHRNDVDGYANAMSEVDVQLGKFMDKMKPEDVLIVTADHGCDPATESTDHSREYVPMLIYGKQLKKGVNLGTRKTFSDIAATVLDIFGVENTLPGESVFTCVGDGLSVPLSAAGHGPVVGDGILDIPHLTIDYGNLIKKALTARKAAYAPYSNFTVGAALLAKDGQIFTGCNVESATFAPGTCAERTAIFTAVAQGVRDFEAIAVVGGKADADKLDYCAPCGVCRQMLAEFCLPAEFVIIIAKSESEYIVKTLAELLPMSFGPEKLR